MSLGSRVFDRVIMDDGDVAWFDGDKYTWHASYNFLAWFMAFGGPTSCFKCQSIPLGGSTSPFRP